ncbi:hypothetical protein XELAEV_18028282mg, partial [Xenopus laevis]
MAVPGRNVSVAILDHKLDRDRCKRLLLLYFYSVPASLTATTVFQHRPPRLTKARGHKVENIAAIHYVLCTVPPAMQVEEIPEVSAFQNIMLAAFGRAVCMAGNWRE